MKHSTFHRILRSAIRLYKLWRKLNRPTVPEDLVINAKMRAWRCNMCRDYEPRRMPWYLFAEYENLN